MLAFMPGMYDQMTRRGLPQEMVVIMKYMVLGFMAVGCLIIPGAMVLFYGSRNVKATCEFRDPRIRWTDKCPLPVLAVSLMCGVGAGSMLSMGLYGWTVPFFGRILSGKAGAGVALVSMLLLGYAAWGTYRLSIKAWWCAVLLNTAWAISKGATFSCVNMRDFYEKMNFTHQQLEIMKQHGMSPYSTRVLFYGIWAFGCLGYLLYTRRYFTSPVIQGNGS